MGTRLPVHLARVVCARSSLSHRSYAWFPPEDRAWASTVASHTVPVRGQSAVGQTLHTTAAGSCRSTPSRNSASVDCWLDAITGSTPCHLARHFVQQNVRILSLASPKPVLSRARTVSVTRRSPPQYSHVDAAVIASAPPAVVIRIQALSRRGLHRSPGRHIDGPRRHSVCSAGGRPRSQTRRWPSPA